MWVLQRKRTERTHSHLYLEGAGSCRCGGWEVQGLHSVGCRPKGARGVSSTLIPSVKGAEDEGPAWRQAERNDSYPAFYSFQTFSGLDEAHPPWGGPSAPLSMPVQMSLPPRSTLIQTLRIMFDQIIRAPHALVKGTRKVDHDAAITKSHNPGGLDVLSHSPGGQQSKITVSAGPCSLCTRGYKPSLLLPSLCWQPLILGISWLAAANLSLRWHTACSLCVWVSCKDAAYWIRAHPTSAGPHLNLIISAKTFFPKKVVFTGTRV